MIKNSGKFRSHPCLGHHKEHLLRNIVTKCGVQRIKMKEGQTMARTDETEWTDIKDSVIMEAHTGRNGMWSHVKLNH